MHDDELTPEQVEELGTLLLAERPRPRETFAAELDARVAARFAQPRSRPGTARATAPHRAGRPRRWSAWLQRPLLPAAATALAVGLVALVVALGNGDSLRFGEDPVSSPGVPSLAEPSDSAGGGSGASSASPDLDASERRADGAAEAMPTPSSGALNLPDAARKVERSAALELAADPDRLDDVAQGVLGVVARHDGIVDQSSVASGTAGGMAQFQLRIPAARLQSALAALSRLPDARVLSRTDEALDVNQAYVSVRRRLANARAERAGVVRALANADTEDETLRLRARLDGLERTIAQAERQQRALDRRVDFSRVSVVIHGDAKGGGFPDTDDGSFTIGDAVHDALRVMEVAAGVIVIAAAALVPVALLAALAWPLVSVTRRRRREQALDAT